MHEVTRSPSTVTSPARSASASPSSATDDPGIAFRSRAIDGRANAEAASITSRAFADRGSRRTRRTSWRSLGIGRGLPAAGVASRSPRAISSAKNGFPPEAAWIRATMGGASGWLDRSRRRRPTSPTSRGPTSTRITLRSVSSAIRSPGSPEASSRRLLASTAIGEPASRRSAKRIARADEASSHWTSSIAMTRADEMLNVLNASRTPSAIARPSGLESSARLLNRAISSARRCGSGASAKASSNTSPIRSPTAEYGRCVSFSPGRDTSTR